MANTIRSKRTQYIRESARKRGYNRRWEREREAWLIEHPFCVECEKQGVLNASRSHHVDHIIPHRGDERLMWDASNWQTLCASHHAEKTRRGQ